MEFLTRLSDVFLVGRMIGGLLIHGILPGTDPFDNHPMPIGRIFRSVSDLRIATLAARNPSWRRSSPCGVRFPFGKELHG